MGSFPGKYIIIANPAEMPKELLAGARAEDTWYRFNNEGELNIGHAMILAPKGSSVPNGIKAQYYEGDRGAAIDNAFKQIGVGFQGVAEPFKVNGIDNTEYHKDFSTQYGSKATTGDSHSYTLESELESMPGQLAYKLKQLQKDFFYTNDNGADAYVTTAGKEIISRNRERLNQWATSNPDAVKASASYFNYINKVMDTYEAIFNKAEQVYMQQDKQYDMAMKQWKASQQPRPGEPPPLNPSPPPMAPGWPPQGLNLQVPNVQMAYAQKNPQGMEESRIIDPEMVDVYYRPVRGSRGKRVVAKKIPMSTVEILLKRISEKYNVPIQSFEYTPSEQVNEISDTTLQSYLGKADRQISNRLDRMSQARERLNKNYEIYDVNNPTKIIDKFEANTPELARRYFEKFIKEYNPGDQNFEFEVRRSTGLSEEGVAEGSENNNTIAQKIFFARSNKTPKGWSYDHVGFITQDGKQIQMSGHKGNDVYVTNDVTDDPEFPKQNIKIVSLSKPVSVPTTNSVGAENCGTFVANVLQANGIKGIDTQKIYSVFKKPHEQGVAEDYLPEK
jgi:hypothetical protein